MKVFTDRRFATCVVVFLSLQLTACDRESSDASTVLTATADPVAARTSGHTFVYECSDESSFTARVEGETAWLFLASGTLNLPQVPSASGAKFQEGSTVYWSKGEMAMLELEGQPGLECRNNRSKAIWEDAKLRGADFRAVGNEPGWTLEISRSYGIVLVTNYGSDRLTFAAPEPTSDEVSRTTTYEISENGHVLTITLEGNRCSDTMSGERFETTVAVVLDDNALSGCGRALH